MKSIFVTGSAGFIGYHLCRLLVAEGFRVHGYDGMTDYYDVTLKQRRHAMLRQSENFHATEALLEDQATLSHAVKAAKPDVTFTFAAQAGVRYSLENPRAYLDANLVGGFNILDLARELNVQHLVDGLHRRSMAQIPKCRFWKLTRPKRR